MKVPSTSPLLVELDWPNLIETISSKTRIGKSKQILTQESVNNWQDSETLYARVVYTNKHSSLIDPLLSNLASFDSLLLDRIFSTINLFELPDLDHVALFYNFYSAIGKSGILNRFKGNSLFKFVNDGTVEFLDYFGQSIENGQFLFHKIPGLKAASFELERIYFEILKLHRENISRINQNSIQNEELIYRDHRYCIAIHSNLYDKKIGRIISHSNSGKTFYVEPDSFAHLNDSYQALLLKYEHIILQFKVESNKLLNLGKDAFYSIFLFILELDISRAKYLYTAKELCIPLFGSNLIEISSLSHPLIEKSIPNDFRQEQDINSLIVTGPNSSGKTIYLKSICLTILMARFGVPLTCKSARLPYLDVLAYPSSSIQNIGEGTSSFVAEFDSLASIFEESGKSLIIWDEAFGNTSSRDATGLIISIVENFCLQKEALFIISTHHDHLKILTKSMDSFVHCSTDPSFRFKILPNFTSESNPFDALRNKRPDSLLLSKIKERAIEISHMKKDTLEEFYGRILSTENERKKLYIDLQNKILTLEKFIIDSEISFAERQSTQAQLDKIKVEFVNTERPREEVATQTQENFESSASVEIGATYKSRSLGIQVKVVSISKKGFECLAKGKRIVLPAEDLVEKSNVKPLIKINVQTSKEDGELTHDLRGNRRDEYLSSAERIVGYVLLGKIPFAKIIFGKGDGALSQATRELERNYNDLNFDYSEDGGSVTIK